jgi:carbamoyltransferase
LTAILGISAFYHDSAATLVVDGGIVAAAQEERFTRRKHDPDFPTNASRYCLEYAGLSTEEIDYVAFYDKPVLKFDRLLETYLAFAPSGFRSFATAMPLWLKQKLHLPRLIRGELGLSKKIPIVFLQHHESHASSAYFPSPFEEAAILTVDGVGEWATASIGHGVANRIELLREMHFPHSLGLLYSAFTYYCGFRVNSGEYKLMGLAPYGTPRYADLIREHLMKMASDGSIWLDMKYFNYCQGLTMTSPAFHDLFGGSPRPPESSIEQRHMDLAASIQLICEEIMIAMAGEAHRLTGSRNLVLAGGVALNCVANRKILGKSPFENIWIQPAAGDAGGSLGAAMFVWHQLLEKARPTPLGDAQHGSFLGPAASASQIDRLLADTATAFDRFDTEEAMAEAIVDLLVEGKIIGLFQGRMEFGPRALGARSIIGDPRQTHMQAAMNLKVKFRESFRPFAPIVLAEHAHEWFDIRPGQESPYMLLVADVLEKHRVRLTGSDRVLMEEDPDLRRRVNVVRSTIPAVTHVDYSARLQTVDAARNPRLHRLLTKFYERTGCPVLVNTSFNVRGEPIVCTPEDAFRCFMATEIDALVLEDVLVRKQTARGHVSYSREEHLAQFQLD